MTDLRMVAQTMTTPLVAPFPWFGGKRRAAPIVWSALGDPGGYIEPFAGSAAVLLARPPYTGRRTETINDADGWLVNTWRAIQLQPGDVVDHLSKSLYSEIDYHARLAWLQARRDDRLVSWLEGDPEACDPKAAAYWLTVTASGIGNPFGVGPWEVVDGHLVRGPDGGRGINRELPHLGNGGQGINRESDLAGYMGALAARLRRVRVTCGDWARVCTPAASRHSTNGIVGVFLDPPYSSGDQRLYSAATDGDAVRDWARSADPTRYRVVLAGYDTEHDCLLPAGWRKVQGKSGRGAGYSTNPMNGRRERLWLSPSCLGGQSSGLW
jgi:site-specific DNA-adenine methylase